MAFLILVISVSLGLLFYRLPELKSENDLDSLLSREAAFLLNNWVLVGLAFATFWGTVFPVLSEWVRGVKITVGPPFFNKVNGPLGVLLLFLTGVGPVIAWRRASAKSLRTKFLGAAAQWRTGGDSLFRAGLSELLCGSGLFPGWVRVGDDWFRVFPR